MFTEPVFSQVLLRLGLAALTGAVIGWERESRGRPAGLRTNILACVASAAAMCLSQLTLEGLKGSGFGEQVRADPARLGAGVLTGIGFLGAGTIIRHENLVRGVTTAATLWLVTILGLAFGAGQFGVAFGGLAIALPTLFLLPHVERFVATDWYGKLAVAGRTEAISEDQIKKLVESKGATVRTIKLGWSAENCEKRVILEIRCVRSARLNLPGMLVTELSGMPGITAVEWE